MSIFDKNEWQNIDEKTGLILPWLTRSFLNELTTWDLSNKKILEIGGGHSTIWFDRKCKELYTIEDKEEWIDYLILNINYLDNSNRTLVNREGNYYYSIMDENRPYDIIIIDSDTDRDFWIEETLKYLDDNGSMIIDNYEQPEVYMASEKTKQLLSSFNCKIYKQDGHPNWQTAMFTK